MGRERAKMNKKLLGALFSILTLAILIAPVIAGKGQNKVDFQFTLIGLPIPDSADRVVESALNTLVKGSGFESLGPSTVMVGLDTYDVVDYEASMHVNQHPADKDHPQGFFTIQVREIIYLDGGTFELQSLGTNKPGNGASFVGFGTDAFEGVKVKGVTAALAPYIADPGPPPVVWYQLDRVGTAMIP